MSPIPLPPTSIYTVTLNPSLDRTLTVPALDFNQVLRASTARLDWGGKGFNVSRALHALGLTSRAIGFTGGTAGAQLAEGLAGLGIPTHLLSIAGETRTSTVVEEESTGRYLKVNEAGPSVTAADCMAILAAVGAHAQPASLWVLAGSLPPGAPADLYSQLIRKIHACGGRALLDASGDPLRAGCAARPWLVKPNAEEAAEFAGMPVETVDDGRRAAQAFLAQGVQLVAMSLGADGLLLVTREQTLHARPPAVTIQTVVGVGDALLAGIVYALHQGSSPADVARWGVAAGTAAAMTPGTGVGARSTVEAIYTESRVTDLREP
jgi:1-phosphofructokinase family hexose kinase